MQEVMGGVLCFLMLVILFYPISYFFKSDNNKLEENIKNYDKNNGKANL